MLAQHALEYVALAVAVGGLFGVVAEVLVKDPALFGQWIGGKTVAARGFIERAGAHSLRSSARTA